MKYNFTKSHEFNKMDNNKSLHHKFCFALQRLKRKYNQKDIAPKLNVNPSTLSRMKTGDLPTSPKIVRKLMKLVKDEGMDSEFEKEFQNYIEENRVKSNEYSEKHDYDIFLASPKLTLERKINRYQQLNELITNDLQHFKLNDATLLSKTQGYAQLENRLMTHIQEAYFGFELVNQPSKELEVFNQQVELLYHNLENEGLKVKYSRENVTLEEAKFDFAPTILRQDYEDILKARSYLIVSPYPRLFTSAWVELGMAMMNHTPVMMIIMDTKKDIPYVITQRTGLRKLYHKEISSIEEISEQYKWVRKLSLFNGS